MSLLLSMDWNYSNDLELRLSRSSTQLEETTRGLGDHQMLRTLMASSDSFPEKVHTIFP